MHVGSCRAKSSVHCTASKARRGRSLENSTVGIHERQCSHRFLYDSPPQITRSFTLRTRTDIETPLDDIQTEKKFSWFKNWWPVQFTYNLDTDRPNRIQLLGEFFAIWKSKSGKWVAMKDMCPHRLAPLSEGRVEEDGTLMCSYHGWRFSECGMCVKIPQADDEKSSEAACINPRSAVKTFPCKAAGSCLWLWPDDSETASKDAEETPLPIPTDFADALDRSLDAGLKPGYTRVVPFNVDVLMENALDPSHFPVAHHKVFRATRDMAGPLKMRFEEPLLSPFPGAAASFISTLGTRRHLEFAAPHRVLYQSGDIDGPSGSRTFVFAVPICSGKSRILNLQVPNKTAQSKSSTIPSNPAMRFFPWLSHMSAFPVTDGINMLLHERDKRLQDLGPKGWKPATYFTPTSADMMVLTYRRWLSDVEGGPQMPDVADDSMNRRQVLDRYDAHVAQCKLCQEGLAFLSNVSAFCRAVAACGFLLGVVLAMQSMQGSLAYWKVAVPFIFSCFFSIFERYLRRNVVPQFYFVDYVHADKN